MYQRRLPFLLLSLIAVMIGPQDSLAANKGVIAFRGAKVESLGKQGCVDNAIVVVRDGKIESVGKDVEIPDNAKIVDLRGKTVLPGVIDPYYAIRVGGGSVPTTRTITIGGRTFVISSGSSSSPLTFVKVDDEFYPYDLNFRPLLRNGITDVNVVANGYGQAALARLTPEDPETMVFNKAGVMFTSVSNDSNRLNALRNGLAGAKSGASTGTQKTSGSSSSSAPSSSSSSRPASTSRSSTRSRTSPEEKALWKEVHDGKRPLIANADNAAGILHLLKILEPYNKVKLVLISTGPNIYRTLEELKKRKPALILQPTVDLAPNSRDRVCVPRMVHEAGLEFAFSRTVSQSNITALQDTPLFSVAYMVKAGLPRDVALAALTKSPAKILGLEKSHGSIEPGKVANLIVFDGDPLDPSSQLEQVYVEGNQVYDN